MRVLGRILDFNVPITNTGRYWSISNFVLRLKTM